MCFGLLRDSLLPKSIKINCFISAGFVAAARTISSFIYADHLKCESRQDESKRIMEILMGIRSMNQILFYYSKDLRSFNLSDGLIDNCSQNK